MQLADFLQNLCLRKDFVSLENVLILLFLFITLTGFLVSYDTHTFTSMRNVLTSLKYFLRDFGVDLSRSLFFSVLHFDDVKGGENVDTTYRKGEHIKGGVQGCLSVHETSNRELKLKLVLVLVVITKRGRLLTYDILINDNSQELIKNRTSSLEVVETLRKTT